MNKKSGSGCKCGQRGSCSNREKSLEFDTLAQCVKSYQTNESKELDSMLEVYRSESNFEKVLESAGWKESPSEDKCHSHQRRLKKDVKCKWKDAMVNNLETIRACRNFKDLHKKLLEIARNEGVFNNAPLIIYDTALRISANLGFEPECVYLHRGAQIPGRKDSKKVVDVKFFPKEVISLKPCHIENFLCIFKDHLEKFATAFSEAAKNVQKV